MQLALVMPVSIWTYNDQVERHIIQKKKYAYVDPYRTQNLCEMKLKIPDTGYT